jgi:cyclopropane fatty-acyl-phospholipid synthase-like methyltransferase
MDDPKVLERMRADWNERAGEDAYYYVAFGRREQDDEEFFATATDVLRLLRGELKRLRARDAALEIGCGPGRLMRPLSYYFGEIHGVDVSDRMIGLAEERLRGTPNAHPHHSSGSDLALFGDEMFDFVYSYAVFQHIPSREVVFQYLAEARRVLKPGGFLWCQLNGLPQQASRYTTWDGVRISPAEIAQFARAHDFQLLRLEGVDTQYMWMTCRKQAAGWCDQLERTEWAACAHLRDMANAYSRDRATPASGRYAAAALAIENLPPDCDINHLEVRVEGRPARVSYIGPPHRNGVVQVNIALPPGTRTGLLPLELDWMGKPLCPPEIIRIIPPAPCVPVLCSLTDGIDLLSGRRIASGIVKVTMEEVWAPEAFLATIDNRPVDGADFFCTDPQTRRFEINFHLPEEIGPGPHVLDVRLGRRKFPAIPIEVA